MGELAQLAQTPQFLSHVIALGEHRTPGKDGVIALDDLAVTAGWDQMHLVSLSLRRPVEPQVFHALRLDKQFPAVARFLATLPRGRTAAYAEFDWGAASKLPHLPRVRYGRAVLSPARWRISATDLIHRRHPVVGLEERPGAVVSTVSHPASSSLAISQRDWLRAALLGGSAMRALPGNHAPLGILGAFGQCLHSLAWWERLPPHLHRRTVLWETIHDG